jgi:hypothetical protein
MTEDRTGDEAEEIAVPPRLYVALEWVAASGELAALREAEDVNLGDLCERSSAAFREAVEAEGGPAGDATVTAALLADLAAWLRGLDLATYARVARHAQIGPLDEP